MAKKRKFVAYRSIERPYTRKSKYRKLNFVRSSPRSKIIRFVMGDKKREFPFNVKLISDTDLQIRDNAIESGRQTANRCLEKNLGKKGFLMKIRKYPHHVLRENALASGAGADRLSTGMKMSFGKPVGVAVQLFKKETIAEIFCEEKDIPVAKTALEKFSKKLPNSYRLVVEKVKSAV